MTKRQWAILWLAASALEVKMQGRDHPPTDIDWDTSELGPYPTWQEVAKVARIAERKSFGQ